MDNVFFCVRLRRHVTTDECRELRSRPRQLVANGQPGVEYKPLACEYCTDGEGLCERADSASSSTAGQLDKKADLPISGIPEKLKPSNEPEKSCTPERSSTRPKGHAAGVCLECGEPRRIIARGLCRRCYSRMHHNGTITRHPLRPRTRIKDHDKPLLRRHDIERQSVAQGGMPHAIICVIVPLATLPEDWLATHADEIRDAVAHAIAKEDI